MAQLGRGDEAESLCLAAVRKFPRDPVPYQWTISRLRKRGRLDKALDYARALGKLEPDNEANQSLIREIEEEMGRLAR